MRARAHTHTHTHLIHTHTHMYIYTYVYIYIYMYTHRHIHTRSLIQQVRTPGHKFDQTAEEWAGLVLTVEFLGLCWHVAKTAGGA